MPFLMLKCVFIIFILHYVKPLTLMFIHYIILLITFISHNEVEMNMNLPLR